MNNRQIQHEIKLSREGTEKYRKDLQQAKSKNYGSNTAFGRDFVRAFVIPFGESLLEHTSKKYRIRARNTPLVNGYKMMGDIFEYLVDPSLVSYISLITIFDCFYTCEGDKPKVQHAFKLIGKRLEAEMRSHYYYKLAPDEAFRKAIHKENNTAGSTPKYKERGVKETAKKLLLNVYNWDKSELFQDWSDLEKLNVGAFVLEVAQRFGIIERYLVNESRNRTITQFRLTEPIKVQTIKYQAALEERLVLYKPLIDTPKEWKEVAGASRFNNTGGYYQDWVKSGLTFCRNFYSDTTFGTDAIKLANTLSKTAWNIDSVTLETAEFCLEKGLSVGKLNAVFEHPLLKQNMPLHLQSKDKSDPLRKKWRSEKKKARIEHREAKAKSRGTRIAVNIAKEYQTEARFYLSWSCDYRGRFYPQQSFLNEDASDFERALLTFSDGCKLDERGLEHAAQAVAEAYIGSKASYSYRSQWTRENSELIKEIAENPKEVKLWETVDKPWQFLQLASEWNRVVLQGTKPLWNIPIGADATSSGLQLLSAFRRDPVGMEYSNLFAPSDINDPPRDAYKRVLEIARETASKDTKYAWLTKYLNDRKLGKIILMKIIYGAKPITNYSEVKAYFRGKKQYPKVIDEDSLKYITNLLRESSKQVFPMAFEALDWIKKLYTTAQKKYQCDSFSWVTPNLDKIDLKKVDQKTKRIKSKYLGNVSLPLSEIKEPAYKRMESSIVPDFVHSYDSCVLKSSFSNWIKPLVVVHDCFKVLPNDMDLAKERIRHGFVHTCSGDPLAKLADDLGITEEELPRLQQGSGRLEDVLNSSYMFN